MARIRFLLFIAAGAIAGALAGRVAADLRRRQEAGEPLEVSLDSVKIRVQDLVPGLVAAARVRDTPWSWLHIPSWLAAFGVNFGVGAVGGDLSRIREMAERAAFGFAGLEFPLGDGEDGPDPRPAVHATVTVEPAEPPVDPAGAPPAPPAPGPGSVTWTAPVADRREDAPAGFTAFSD